MTRGRDTADDSQRDDLTWHHGEFASWDTDERALRAARNEARESLAETIRSIRRIDESAMKTLRIDLVILGLSLTAASSFQFTARLLNGLTISGFVAVSLSALVAVVTTLGSDYPTGVSEEYVEEFQRASWSEREWNAWMLSEYSRWLSDANQMANGEARVLFYTKALLGVGLTLLILGISSGIAGFVDSVTGIEMAAATHSTVIGFKYDGVHRLHMGKSPKTGREVEPQRGRKGPKIFARIVRYFAKDDE